ncbi:hypothetical protein BJY16_007526 [Actinoplanes octamycinicus]|uniref:OmpA family protein n=1 Tax=Actinoplanes octamycinicus TaxID=135948 RepID=A0A7W7H5L1_9ACTN|nr:hypothetical protein [Actinoplanes octamycinicus]MBB4744067.1 hypothetical protein [Actinoplanes octamycinicus]GIE56976.1 hypothetical protein Aoc01nite_23780 [Actinoplanes octamycinicus]
MPAFDRTPEQSVVPARRTALPIRAHAPAHRLLTLQKRLGNTAVQRLVVRTPDTGMGARVALADDDSQVDLSLSATYWVGGRAAATTVFGATAQTAAITVASGTSGVLQVRVHAVVDIDNSPPFDDLSYAKDFFADFPITVAPDGTLQIDAGLVRDEGLDLTTQLYVESVEPLTGADWVQLNVRITTTTSHGRSGGVGYVINEGIGGRSWIRQFRLAVRTPAHPAVRERGHRTYFERPRQDAVSLAEQDRLIAWFQSLPEPTQARVRDGRTPVVLIGRASTTGDTALNLRLSAERMAAVRRILEVFAGNRVQFHTRAEGEYTAGTEDAVESREQRRVDVSVLDNASGP